MASMAWSKGAGDLMTASVGPFALEILPTSDGRWSWRIFKVSPAGGPLGNPTATGIAGSLAAAKNVTEQFVKRSGLV
jgi:hypothetical protein